MTVSQFSPRCGLAIRASAPRTTIELSAEDAGNASARANGSGIPTEEGLAERRAFAARSAVDQVRKSAWMSHQIAQLRSNDPTKPLSHVVRRLAYQGSRQSNAGRHERCESVKVF